MPEQRVERPSWLDTPVRDWGFPDGPDRAEHVRRYALDLERRLPEAKEPRCRCGWCGKDYGRHGLSEVQARTHAVTCDENPVVRQLAAVTEERDRLREFAIAVRGMNRTAYDRAAKRAALTPPADLPICDCHESPYQHEPSCKHYEPEQPAPATKPCWRCGDTHLIDIEDARPGDMMEGDIETHKCPYCTGRVPAPEDER